MLRVALKGVMARKLRLLLTSIAVVLGVGFVAGAFFLTDSVRSSFKTLFTEAAQGIDVQVTTKAYDDLREKAATAQPGTVPIDLSKVGVPPEVVRTVRETPGVARAEGTVFELGAQPLDKHGKPLGGQGPPSFAVGWVDRADGAAAGVLKLVKGRAPRADEVLLDAGTMRTGKFSIGDEVRVLVQGGRSEHTYRISGVVKFGDQASLLGATITVFKMSTVQELLGMDGRFSSVDALAEEGVSQRALKTRIQTALGDRYSAITGAEFTKQQTETIDSAFLNIVQNVILGFAAIAVFVGAFTIFNTFTILVGQRTREFGLLRALGASRRQILGVVIVEAILLGVLASALGIAAGYGVAAALRALINSGGAVIPTTAFPLHPRTVVWSFSVGIGVTLIASFIPAWRAARLSPLEALRGSMPMARAGWRLPAVGLLLALVGSGLVISGLNNDSGSTSTILSSIGGGFALAIVGLALLSRSFIAPVTRVLALVLARGTSGRLATRNVLRNRARAASTAAALMVGLALASLVLVFFSSLKATVNDQIDQIVGSDISIYNSSAQGGSLAVVGDDVVSEVRNVDGVTSVVGQRTGGAMLRSTYDINKGKVETVAAYDAAALAPDGALRLKMRSGSAQVDGGVLVERDLANQRGWKAGDEVPIAFPTGATRRLSVKGIYDATQLVPARVIISKQTFDEVEPVQIQAASLVLVSVAADANPRKVVTRIKRALGSNRSYLVVQDNEQLRKQVQDQLAPVLGLVLGMLSLSLIIALFGIGNTMALNVFERTREIGLLRAVGGTRRQLGRMIRIEAVLVALFGAVVGVVVGVGAAVAVVTALKDQGFVFTADPLYLVGVLVAGIVAGLLASILPARRAARTDVLAAIATD